MLEVWIGNSSEVYQMLPYYNMAVVVEVLISTYISVPGLFECTKIRYSWSGLARSF